MCLRTSREEQVASFLQKRELVAVVNVNDMVEMGGSKVKLPPEKLYVCGRRVIINLVKQQPEAKQLEKGVMKTGGKVLKT